MLLDCKTLDCEYLPLKLGDCSLVIIDSNKPHNLIESKYNERRAETEDALSILQKKMKISTLADISPTLFKNISTVLPQKIRRRAEHVVNECERVRLAKQALQVGNVEFLGKLLNASHSSLSNLYEVTGRELDMLATAAQGHWACVGSRMTGAGFGGCTISLVKTDGIKEFKQQVCERYNRETGYTAKCYEAEIANGITVKKL